MKKGIIMILAVLMVFFTVSGSQAALIELVGLTDLGPAATPGEMEFGVYLTDMGSLPNIDLFNVGLMISGAPGLEMSDTDVEGPSLSEYIFYDNSFSFSAGNPGGDLSRLVFGDVTDNGLGEVPAGDALLGWITLSYPGLEPWTEVTLSLIPGMSYVESDFDTGYIEEELILTGQTTINVVPIPATVWILGGGILALLRIRRWRLGC
jgi:hypothetical protein